MQLPVPWIDLFPHQSQHKAPTQIPFFSPTASRFETKSKQKYTKQKRREKFLFKDNKIKIKSSMVSHPSNPKQRKGNQMAPPKKKKKQTVGHFYHQRLKPFWEVIGSKRRKELQIPEKNPRQRSWGEESLSFKEEEEEGKSIRIGRRKEINRKGREELGFTIMGESWTM